MPKEESGDEMTTDQINPHKTSFYLYLHNNKMIVKNLASQYHRAADFLHFLHGLMQQIQSENMSVDQKCKVGHTINVLSLELMSDV